MTLAGLDPADACGALPLWVVQLSLALNLVCLLLLLGRLAWSLARRYRHQGAAGKKRQELVHHEGLVPCTALAGAVIGTSSASSAAQAVPSPGSWLPLKRGVAGAEAICQTDPIFAVELVPGPRLPVDVVAMLDASSSIPAQERASAARVVRELLLQLSLQEEEGDSPSSLRVLRFGSRVEVLGDSAVDPDALLSELDHLARDGGAPLGEAWLATPLLQAGALLDFEAGPQRLQAVVVLSSCESLDREDALMRAEELKNRGARLVVLPPLISAGDQRSRARASLQHWRPVDLTALASSKEDVVDQMPWMDGDVAFGAALAVLQRLLQVRMHIGAAKCTMLLGAGSGLGLPGACRVSPDLSREDGEPIGGNLCATRATPVLAPWRPSAAEALVPLQVPRSLRFPQSRGGPAATPVPAAHRVLGRETVAVQTEPIVQAEFVEDRQTPLDIVMCLDSSASVGEINFQRMRGFLRRVVGRLDWPETRCGVIRFSSQAEVLGLLNSDPWKVDSALQSAGYQVGETLLAPALEAAREIFERSPMRAGARRILLLATDDRPNDTSEGKLEKQAVALLSRGVELVVLAAGVEPEGPCCGYQDSPSKSPQSPGSTCSWAASKAGLHVVRATSFQALEDSDRGLQVLEELLRRIVCVRRVMTRAKVRLPPSTFQELKEPFALGPGEFELSLNGVKVEAAPTRWHGEPVELEPRLPRLCGSSAPGATYPLWEESQLRCGHHGDAKSAAARSGRLSYVKAAMDEETLVAPDGFGRCSACEVRKKLRPASPPVSAAVTSVRRALPAPTSTRSSVGQLALPAPNSHRSHGSMGARRGGRGGRSSRLEAHPELANSNAGYCTAEVALDV
eukprot:TRINITY_DN23306_c0_g1_i1.p1 TRINITY_DN23306_c0_g1~~TRINITY_DN23306_c0_g1_i1.p1  ORF type:complete len:854 (-),score=161.23 TRINITY_DN23306_c0_g1_i1:267-2828(-)